MCLSTKGAVTFRNLVKHKEAKSSKLKSGSESVFEPGGISGGTEHGPHRILRELAKKKWIWFIMVAR